MKLTNKTLIAALLLAVTLTGCDSLKNKLKNTEDKKVEEAADDKTEKKEGEEDAENTGSTEKEDSEDTKEENKEEDKEEGKEEGEDKDKKASEAETDPGSTDKEIFHHNPPEHTLFDGFCPRSFLFLLSDINYYPFALAS